MKSQGLDPHLNCVLAPPHPPLNFDFQFASPFTLLLGLICSWLFKRAKDTGRNVFHLPVQDIITTIVMSKLDFKDDFYHLPHILISVHSLFKCNDWCVLRWCWTWGLKETAGWRSWRSEVSHSSRDTVREGEETYRMSYAYLGMRSASGILCCSLQLSSTGTVYSTWAQVTDHMSI